MNPEKNLQEDIESLFDSLKSLKKLFNDYYIASEALAHQETLNLQQLTHIQKISTHIQTQEDHINTIIEDIETPLKDLNLANKRLIGENDTTRFHIKFGEKAALLELLHIFDQEEAQTPQAASKTQRIIESYQIIDNDRTIKSRKDDTAILLLQEEKPQKEEKEKDKA